MNKTLRFLIVVIVLLVALLASTWKINAQTCFGGGIVSKFSSRNVTTEVVQEKNTVQPGLTFVEFFAGNRKDCAAMKPIVSGIKKRSKACLMLERLNFHSQSKWHEWIRPVGSPVFALLDASGKVVYCWIGFTE